MTTQTPDQQTTATEWHPDWCRHSSYCSPNTGTGDIHYSEPRGVHGSTGEDGEELAVHVRATCATEWGVVHDRSAHVTITALEELDSSVELHVSPARMRNLAMFLLDMAAVVDELHAGVRATLHDEEARA